MFLKKSISIKTKRILYFILLILLFTSTTYHSQTTLSPGDIAVIAFKTNTSSQSGNDAVKLVTLVDLQCNTQFIVTDNNWNGSAWACNDDEAGLQITCNVAIAAGSVFYIDYDSPGNTVSCSGGSISRADLGSPWGSNFGFNSGGDNVYILQGTRAAPVFVYAFKHVGAFASSTCSDKDRANLPSNLTLGTSAIVMASSQNQWNYNCVSNSGTKTSILSAISNTSNWINNSTAHVWDASNCIFRVSSAALPYGVLAVSGAGCGCLANCNLAYAGGVNCGSTGVAGDCTAGEQPVSATITVPAGCTYNVIATMRSRSNGCSSSGADGGGTACATCDILKVDILGGVKAFQFGSSNASLNDNYSLVGPGTIVVSGSANRADEIITYSIQATPCSCLPTIILPIELLEFNAKLVDKSVELNWTTATEYNNKYFTIERSSDASSWEATYVLQGQGNSSIHHNYKVYDSSPLKGISYYRLKQTDFDGRYAYSHIASINNSINDENRKVIKTVNMLGQEVSENSSGLLILIYDNGDVRKMYRE